MDPMGLAYVSTTYNSLIGFGGEALNASEFEELVYHPSILKYKPKLIVGGQGSWQISEAKAQDKFGIDVLFQGEGEKDLVKLFKKIMCKGEGMMDKRIQREAYRQKRQNASKRNGFRILTLFVFFSLTIFWGGTITAQEKGTVRVGFSFDILTPNVVEDKGVTFVIGQTVHQSLMTLDPKTGEYMFELAKSIEVMPNKKDFKVKLKKGVRFHTGDPVTTHDLVFTHEQRLDPENGYVWANLTEEVEEIEIINDYTCIIRFYESYGPWRELMRGAVCSKKYYDNAGKEKFRNHPIGSGPFRFVEYKMDDVVTLEAVDSHRKNVGFKTLKFVYVPDRITQISMLKTGELDLIFHIPPHEVKGLKQNKNIKIKRGERNPTSNGIGFDQYNYPFMNDFNLRQALRYAVNNRELTEKIFLGEAYPLYQSFGKASMVYDPTLTIEYNPRKAKEFLKKSSYKGQELLLTYSATMPYATQVVQAIQKYLEDIGVNVKPQQLEGAMLATYTRSRDKRKGHMSLWTYAPSFDPNYKLMLSVLSSGPFTIYHNRPNKEEMDKLVLAQSHEVDLEKRKAILKKINDIMFKDPSSIYLYGINLIYAMRGRIEYTSVPRTDGYFGFPTIKIAK
jgi:peptide/nickel transport system substrate-binding protein